MCSLRNKFRVYSEVLPLPSTVTVVNNTNIARNAREKMSSQFSRYEQNDISAAGVEVVQSGVRVREHLMAVPESGLCVGGSVESLTMDQALRCPAERAVASQCSSQQSLLSAGTCGPLQCCSHNTQ